MNGGFCIICGKSLTGRQTKFCSDKECYREKRKGYRWKYRQNNRAEINARRREYGRNNRERLADYNRRYRLNNLERLKKYYQDNKERYNEHSRKYYHNNREKMNEYSLKYDQDNPEQRLERNRRSYRNVRGLPEDADLFKESSIERIMKDWLQDSDIEFELQYFINLEGASWTRADFFIPELNICLYCDGDYWHSLPEVQERDIRINKTLEEMGYNIVRLTETEILKGVRINV